MNTRDAMLEKHPVEGSRLNQDPLSRLLNPQSIAVIGASRNPKKLSGRPVDYLKRFGFTGRILPVNPAVSVLQEIRCYADLESIDGQIDVALIVLPAEQVPAAVKACAARGVGTAIVTAGGFSEMGSEGHALEAALHDAIAGSGMRLLGPNCLGMIGLRDGAVPTFTASLDDGIPLKAGPAAFISQSGAFGSFLFGEFQAAGVGLTHYINTGNELDITVSDLLRTMLDGDASLLLAYFEGISDGRDLLKVVRQAHTRDKPIVVVKSGRTTAGGIAAQSHTASLAGDDAVFDALMRESGVVRVPGQEPLVDAAQMFNTGRRAAGRKLTIVTESGGAGVLMSDYASEAGLVVAPWEPEWQQPLALELPSFASSKNPIDLTGQMIVDTSLVGTTLRHAVEHPGTDMVCVMVGNADKFGAPVIAAIDEVYRTTDKPFGVVWTGGTGEPRRRLQELGIPCYTDPGRAATALGRLADYSMRSPLPDPIRPAGIDRSTATSIIENAVSLGHSSLDEDESSRVLRAYGIPVARSMTATSAAEAANIASGLSAPVVAKVLSKDIQHKSDVGGVRLNLQGEDDVSTAVEELLELQTELGGNSPRVLLQEMVEGDAEFIVGGRNDPSFGPVVVTGMGGIFVEVLRDSGIVSAPTDHPTATRIVDALQGAALLEAVRGRPALDRDALIDVVVRVSWLMADFAQTISDLDVNPVLVRRAGDGAVAVDGLILLSTATN